MNDHGKLCKFADPFIFLENLFINASRLFRPAEGARRMLSKFESAFLLLFRVIPSPPLLYVSLVCHWLRHETYQFSSIAAELPVYSLTWSSTGEERRRRSKSGRRDRRKSHSSRAHASAGNDNDDVAFKDIFPFCHAYYHDNVFP